MLISGSDISFAPAPPSTKLLSNGGDGFANLFSLGHLISPSESARVIKEQLLYLPASSFSISPAIHSPPQAQPGKPLVEPDDQVACFDLLYYTATYSIYEWGWDWTPTWNAVGKYVRWNETVLRIAEGYVERLLGGMKVAYFTKN